MERQAHQRIRNVAFAATLAAAVVVPYSALACSARAAEAECCCRAQRAASTECAIKTCDCCRPAAPQTIPPDRTSDRFPSNGATSVSIAALPHADVASDLQSTTAPTGDRTAIPHRILHCTWLI